MEPIELIQDLNRSYALELVDRLTLEELENFLAEKIDTMIRMDFGALVQLLYRIDVSEAKLRELLAAADGPAGKIIARLIMERQWQKIETRRKYNKPGEGTTGSDEERW
jgi:hypothetical protein